MGLLDVRTTPLGDTVPGVSVHAQALEQVLTGTYLLRPDWVDPLEILLIVVLGLTVALTVIFSGPVLALGLGGLIAFNASVGSWIAFRNYGLLFDPLFALGTALALHFALTSFRYLVTDRDKRFVRRAFGRYVSPAILAKIEQNPKALRLGGEVRDLTILFLDIRSFTSLSEKLSPTELIEFLNRILGQLSDVIVERPARSINIWRFHHGVLERAGGCPDHPCSPAAPRSPAHAPAGAQRQRRLRAKNHAVSTASGSASASTRAAPASAIWGRSTASTIRSSATP